MGTLNLNPNKNEKIFFGGGIDGEGGDAHGTINIDAKGEVWVKNELIYHDVNLNSGTLVITPSTSAKASRFVIEEQAKFSANNTVFENSHAEGKNGGAIYNEGTLQIENSVDFVLPNKDNGGIDKY